MKRFALTRLAEERASPTVTRRVLKRIRTSLVLLGSEPGLGHVREELTDKPLKFWPVYSYLIDILN